MSAALIARRLAQTAALVRLAGMRRDIALRDLAQARAALVDAVAARDAADRAARALAEEQAARREALRAPTLRAAQARGALDAVLTTFAADRDREAAADKAVADAALMIVAAREDVATAQAALGAAERRLDQRERLRAPLLDARLRGIERRAELEAEERPGPARGASA